MVSADLLRMLTIMTLAAGMVSCRIEGTGRVTVTLADTIGDTVVLRMLPGRGDWGGDRVLMPDVVIGREGQGSVVFGAIEDVALLPDGGIAVADPMVPTVLEFSRSGEFVRSLGAEGQGPGEYRSLGGLAVVGRRDLAVADPRNRKVIIFDSTGAVEQEWPLRNDLSGPGLLSRDDGGRLAVRSSFRWSQGRSAGAQASHVGFRVTSESGVALDSAGSRITDQAGWGRWFQQRVHHAWHPAGFLVHGHSGTYVIDQVRKDGTVVRILGEWRPVELEGDERRSWEELRTLVLRRGGRVGPPELPAVKPAFKSIVIARTGEVWVVRYTRAMERGRRSADLASGGADGIPWVEPFQADVFGGDGAFLGSVSGPPEAELRAVSGDTVWAASRGALGEPLLVRYLVRPSR